MIAGERLDAPPKLPETPGIDAEAEPWLPAPDTGLEPEVPNPPPKPKPELPNPALGPETPLEGNPPTLPAPKL